MRLRRETWARRRRRASGADARQRVLLVTVLAELVLTATASGQSVAPPLLGGIEEAPPGISRAPSTVDLSDGRLREAVGRLEAGQPAGPDVTVVGDEVLVEVLHTGDAARVREFVTDHGGEITGYAGDVLLEALVPFRYLVALEHEPQVRYLRPPLRANEPVVGRRAASATAAPAAQAAVIGEEVSKTNAAAWHDAGITGAGVKVGIVDGFDGTAWNAAQAAGEVPAPAGTFCRLHGTPCDIWASGSKHGEGVAEIVHEMAPEAQVYIATAVTTADLQAAVDYFAGQGVRILSRSLTAEYDGPGDGTGPIASVVNSAVAQGMTWFNAAGNSAGGGGIPFGSYWRGGWADGDSDGFLNFSGSDELLGLGCYFVNGLRWNDWGASKTDYDIYVLDNPSDTVPKAYSVNNQGSGADPLEHVHLTCAGASDVDYLAVHLYSAGASTAGDILEFMVNGSGLEYWQNPYSAAAPAADTASAGGLAIGAIDPPVGVTIADYSSQGPTNDQRIKPDLTAAACVASFTYSPNCFNGTSAATPVAAGAAALVLSAGLATTPAQLKAYLRTHAVVDRGAPGADNVYGSGELILPTPPGPGKAPGDYDGDGDTDIAVWRPLSGIWFVHGGLTQQWGAPSDIPVPGDYDGDGDTDIAVWRPSNGIWYVLGGVTQQWGAPTDVPVPCDYDGDGDDDIAVWRPSNGIWYVLGGVIQQWGAPTDVPVPGDYDGDGDCDIAVWRPANGIWYVLGRPPVQWGAPTDVPLIGDGDGDGDTEIAVWRPSNGVWYVLGLGAQQWGAPTDIPVPGDYDGDGDAGIAVWRPANGIWYVLGGGTQQWGAPTDVPVVTPAWYTVLY